jgi:hypothetical protein
MRRIIALSVASLALVATAACSEKPAAAPSAAATTAIAIDKATACASLKKATADMESGLEAAYPSLMGASGDDAKTAAAVAQLLTVMTDFQAAYGKDVASISDSELKAAVEADLSTLSPAIDALRAAGNDTKKLEEVMMSDKFIKGGDDVKRICGF